MWVRASPPPRAALGASKALRPLPITRLLPATAGPRDYVGEWYKNQDFQPNATQFAVTAGSVTKKINFSLSQGGGVSGTVTDSVTGDPVPNVLVVGLWTTSNQASTFAVCTSATGTYKLQDVPTSGAIVWFDTASSGPACGLATPYDEEYYLNCSLV